MLAQNNTGLQIVAGVLARDSSLLLKLDLFFNSPSRSQMTLKFSVLPPPAAPLSWEDERGRGERAATGPKGHL